MIVRLAAVLAAVALVAGCASSASGGSRPTVALSSPAAAAPSPAALSVNDKINLFVCQKYERTRAWALGLSHPTLSDAISAEAAVALEAQEAVYSSPVGKDLRAMAAGMKHSSRPDPAVKAAIVRDCQALGVKFYPPPGV